MNKQKSTQQHDLDELCSLYSSMNEKGQQYLVGMARQLQRSFPAAPSLTLVEGAREVKLLKHRPHSGVNQLSLVTVSHPVDRQQTNLG